MLQYEGGKLSYATKGRGTLDKNTFYEIQESLEQYVPPDQCFPFAIVNPTYFSGNDLEDLLDKLSEAYVSQHDRNIYKWRRNDGPEHAIVTGDSQAFIRETSLDLFERLDKSRQNELGGRERKKERLPRHGAASTSSLPSIEAVIERAYSNGADSLSKADCRALRLFASNRENELEQQERKSFPRRIRQLARELFPEIKSNQPVTPERLTRAFAERANPPDGSKARKAMEQEVRQVKELFDQWRNTYGPVTIQGEAVSLDTPLRGKRRVFRVRTANKEQLEIHKRAEFPKLEF